MDLALDIFVVASLAAGVFFALTGAVGILRMPDFYSRLHPAGKNDSMGLFFITLGLLVETVKYEYGYLVAGKLLLIAVFVFVTSPVANYAVTKGAWLGGLRPWTRDGPNSDRAEGCDD
jgi:multicomponent Na+:H+ antiporter subunit G